MDVKKILAIIAGALAIISLIGGPGVLVAVAVIILAIVALI